MRFQSFREWIILNEGGDAIPDSRSITFDEARDLYSWIMKNIPEKFGISSDDIDIIGSYGKKTEGEFYGDLDVAVSEEALYKNNG